MMAGKRKKDPEFYELRELLQQFVDKTEQYRRRLEGEMGAAHAEPEPYMHLIRALERQIATVRELEAVLDDRVWPVLVQVANGSAYVEHTRTRDFF
jgi:hypothetical protein